MDVDYDTLQALRKTHPAWKLLVAVRLRDQMPQGSIMDMDAASAVRPPSTP
jgi:hypothetical protein